MKTKLLILLFVLSKSAFSQTALTEYLKIAAENNPGLKAKFNAFYAEQEKTNQTGTLPDPQVAFNYFIVPVETKLGPQQFNVQLKQQFPWLGTLSHQKDAVTAFANVKYEIALNAKSNLFFDVKSTYYSLYFNKKAQDIVSENLTILETFKSLSLVKVEAGKTTLVDVYRIEMEINELQNQLENLKDEFKAIEIKFHNLLNVNSVELSFDDSLEMNEVAVDTSLLHNNHLIQSLNLKLAAFESQEIVVKDKGKPSFSIGVGYTSIGENSPVENAGRDAFLFPSVTFKLPVYREKYNSMIKEVELRKIATSDTKSEEKNRLKTILALQDKQIKKAIRKYKLDVEQIRLAENAIKILLETYQTEAINFEEILRMERKILMYNLEKEKAVIDNNIAVAFVEYLYGN